MALFVEKPGILTTIQDLGRPGWRRLGIPSGGAMDAFSASLANLLVGNEPGAALLEFHFPGPVFQVEKNCFVALAGAGRTKMDDRFFENGRPFFLRKGEQISFSPDPAAAGARGYFAVAGGFEIQAWLGSRATLLSAKTGGFEGRELQTGDRLEIGAAPNFLKESGGWLASFFENAGDGPPVFFEKQPAFGLSKNHFLPPEKEPTLACLPGPEFVLLFEKFIQLIESQWFSVQPASNRMGLRLLGEPVFLSQKMELISSAVAPGTVQLLPDGQLIALGPDCQTTGGYPRIFQVISAHLPGLGQLRAGDRCRFRLVETGEAELLLRSQRQVLRQIRAAVKLALVTLK